MTVATHRHLVGASALIACLLSLLVLPYGSAHGGTPVEYNEADLTLGPEGGPQGLYHLFGFQMSPGDVLHMQYVVTSPQTQAVDFSVHRHNATGKLEILNVTKDSLQLDRSIQDSGFYMPQWLNLITKNLTLHYIMYYVRGPSPLDLIEAILAMGIPAGLLGLFAFTYFRNKGRDRQESDAGSQKKEKLDSRDGDGPKGAPRFR